MYFVRRIIVLLSFTIILVDANNQADLGTIVFANVLFRHGDRTPVDPYPNDPYGDESLWPVPFGQLTNLGKIQHLELGRWLRKRYAGMLPDLYSPDAIYVRSTDVDRTLMSAEVNLAGLFPPRGNQIWSNLTWMPIPVHTLPENEDNLLAGKKYCARYAYELDLVKNSPEMKMIDRKNKDLYRYLSKKSGAPVAGVEDVEYLYNTLFIEELYNFTLPEWTKAVYPDKLKPLAELSFTIPVYNKILQRLKIGVLLGEMREHFVTKSKGTLSPDRQVWIYSAHDTTIANLLMTLDLFEPHCPPYVATVLLELRRNSKENYFVTIWYKNTTEPVLLALPGCKASCPLNQFVKIVDKMIPENWDKECSIGWDSNNGEINATTIVAILSSMGLILILLVLLIIGFVYWHHNREHNQRYSKLATDPI